MTYPRVDRPGYLAVRGVVVNVYPCPPLIGIVPSRSMASSVGIILAIFVNLYEYLLAGRDPRSDREGEDVEPNRSPV